MSQPDKRRRILDAAVKVFATYGFYLSKVSQIAKEAGVADGTIYLYFKSKDDILIQIFMDSMEEMIAIQERSLAEAGDPAEKLSRFIRNHLEACTRSRALAEVITVELRQSSRFMRGTDMKPFGRYLRIIGRIVSEGQAGGQFDPRLSPRLASRMLFGVLDEMALEWAMEEEPTSVDEIGSHVAQVFSAGLSAPAPNLVSDQRR
jgi:TetR/AcrR family fatty acid metabolism transcriptional regulator